VVRRVNKRLRPAAPPPPPPGPKIAASHKASGGERRAPALAVAAPQVWERFIVGSFQVKIPVLTGAAMRPAEETTLAILKARLEGWPKASPWYPVLLRYVELIVGRVQGVGGDPGAIPPSFGGYRPGRPVCEPGVAPRGVHGQSGGRCLRPLWRLLRFRIRHGGWRPTFRRA
jgi:hypothetical protein